MRRDGTCALRSPAVTGSQPAAGSRWKPLTNDRWGFESNCFVCEDANPSGLRIPFFHDEDNDVVTADFELDDRFSGAPSFVHGGLQLAILDEAMAWAAIAIAHRWAMTGETTTRFDHPVRLGRSYTVTARVTDPPADGSSSLGAAAVITDHRDRTCASATATFVVLGEALAAEAVGQRPDQLDASYIRPQ